nr:PREDICTED: uncharacterized protein LOC109038711 [Bemisia tabaci]
MQLFVMAVIVLSVSLITKLDAVLEQSFSGREQILSWANGAYAWLKSQSCAEPVFADEKTCLDVTGRPKAEVRLYAAGPNSNGPLTAVFPDGEARHAGSHDAILVLDPYPNLRFGHFVLMFFVDFNTPNDKCAQENGTHFDNGDCLYLAKKHKCNNRNRQSLRRRLSHSNHNCELMYLPLVHVASEPAHQNQDLLECQSNMTGFEPSCPGLRARSLTNHMQCDPLLLNTNKCDTTSYVRTRCPFMQTCDHAVLLSGGWNRQLGDEGSLRNIFKMNDMLRKNGFLESNIKIFFANGMNHDEMEGLDVTVYSSALKLALRYHLRTVCETEYCADSLVIYLHSPARPDGASLLWDSDGNGKYDETETYTVREFLRDIQGCSARRVVVVADQSFSAELVSAATQHSTSLNNVVIVAANSPSRRDQLTHHFAHSTHEHTCLHQLIKGSRHAFNESDHSVYVGRQSGLLNTTLMGAPCHLNPPPSALEMSQKYRGCQNLSTRDLIVGTHDEYTTEPPDS